MKLIYTALSKHLFYFRSQISQFVIEQGAVPLNPFMIFEYFLGDTVKRELIYQGNRVIVERSDELWIFGPISDGVLDEIRIANKAKKPIRYFEVVKSKNIKEVTPREVIFEEDLDQFRHEL
jgi:hypothetical protein